MAVPYTMWHWNHPDVLFVQPFGIPAMISDIGRPPNRERSFYFAHSLAALLTSKAKTSCISYGYLQYRKRDYGKSLT